MASSKSSLNLSIPTYFLLLFIGCFRPSSSSSLRTNPDERWRNPCEGHTVPGRTKREATDSFAQLSNRSIGLKAIVNDIKNEYVTVRFDEVSLAEEERENADFNITGIPSWTGSSANMNETLLVCYENLARLAVLTRLTREEEETADGNRDFATHFERIEEHARSGLYVILCHLYAVMTDLHIEVMSPETVVEVSSIRLPNASSNAIRHVRDYMVLLVLEDSADKLNASFNRLAVPRASPRLRQSRQLPPKPPRVPAPSSRGAISTKV